MAWQERYERAVRQIAEAERQRGLTEYRCPDCGALLGYYEPPVRLVQIKCRKCGLYSELRVMSTNGTHPAAPEPINP
jgi:DNA-directed RNA polymerase subunit RPC12/RpoP